jgi:hypothetical protein
MSSAPMDEPDWSQFTENGFRALLKALKAENYHFVFFGESEERRPSGARQVLWRHDVDVSMHRAARLGAIEAEEGVQATYFLNPRCEFYNLAEPGILQLARSLAAQGHALGLHFDAGAYDTTEWTLESLRRAVGQERSLLEAILGAPVQAMSRHNPDLSNLLEFKDETVCGLINAYSEGHRRDFVYASDSNGYWRFKPMEQVIGAGHERLHLLTHPEWWTPEPLSPSARIDRALQGRARVLRSVYDQALEAAGRLNVGRGA